MYCSVFVIPGSGYPASSTEARPLMFGDGFTATAGNCVFAAHRALGHAQPHVNKREFG